MVAIKIKRMVNLQRKGKQSRLKDKTQSNKMLEKRGKKYKQKFKITLQKISKNLRASHGGVAYTRLIVYR